MEICGGQSNFGRGVKVRSLAKFSIAFQRPHYPSFAACCPKLSICVFHIFDFCLLSFCLSVCQFNTVCDLPAALISQYLAGLLIGGSLLH